MDKTLPVATRRINRMLVKGLSGCAVSGCRVECKPGHLMCRCHWHQVAVQIRSAISRHQYDVSPVKFEEYCAQAIGFATALERSLAYAVEVSSDTSRHTSGAVFCSVSLPRGSAGSPYVAPKIPLPSSGPSSPLRFLGDTARVYEMVILTGRLTGQVLATGTFDDCARAATKYVSVGNFSDCPERSVEAGDSVQFGIVNHGSSEFTPQVLVRPKAIGTPTAVDPDAVATDDFDEWPLYQTWAREGTSI